MRDHPCGCGYANHTTRSLSLIMHTDAILSACVRQHRTGDSVYTVACDDGFISDWLLYDSEHMTGLLGWQTAEACRTQSKNGPLGSHVWCNIEKGLTCRLLNREPCPSILDLFVKLLDGRYQASHITNFTVKHCVKPGVFQQLTRQCLAVAVTGSWQDETVAPRIANALMRRAIGILLSTGPLLDSILAVLTARREKGALPAGNFTLRDMWLEYVDFIQGVAPEIASSLTDENARCFAAMLHGAHQRCNTFRRVFKPKFISNQSLERR